MKRAWSKKNLWNAMPLPIRATLGRGLGCLPLPLLLGRSFRQHYDFLRRSEQWSVDQLQEVQLRKLRSLLRLAYEKTAYYRRQFDAMGFCPDDLTSPDDLRRLPTIDRKTVQEHLAEMCTLPLNHPAIDRCATGGTSGEPLVFYMGKERSPIEYAYLSTSWNRIGYRIGMPLAVLRGQVVRPDRRGLRHLYDPLLRHHYYSAFHLTRENIRAYLDHIATLGSCFLHVYPSSADALARIIRQDGLTPPANIRGLIAESEIVYPDQREHIQTVFGRRLFSLYGHSEKLVLASECEHTNLYHVWPTYGYFELLDDDGTPVTTPGRRGEIVGTGFVDAVTLFIRYCTGDYATYIADRCAACGRNHPLITDIRGHRVQEYLVAADGTEISWTAMNMHDDTFDHVRQFQFYQDTPGRGVLRIIPDDRFGDRDTQRISRNLDQKFDGRFHFTIELRDAIPLSPRGKAIYVDQHIPS